MKEKFKNIISYIGNLLIILCFSFVVFAMPIIAIVQHYSSSSDIKNESIQDRSYSLENSSKKAKSTAKSTLKKKGSSSSYSESKSSSSDVEYAEDGYVYITPTGSCYHTHKCGNGSFRKVTIDEAIERGLEPCSKCF